MAATVAASVQAPMAASCRITLNAYSQVPGPQLMLGDIAALACTLPEDSQTLSRVSLGEAAHFGMTRLVDVERLQTFYLRDWQGRFVLTAPGPTVQVETASDTLSDDALQAHLDALLASEPLGPRLERTVTWVKPPRRITLPKGSERDLRLVFSGLKRSGKVPLELRIGLNGKVLRKQPLTVDIRLKGPVAVAKRVIRRGETFTADNLAEEVREVTLASPGATPGRDECLGKRASATLIAGRMVTLHLVDVPPRLRKGESAALITTQGVVQVAVDAIVRRDGHDGEVVPVWNTASRKMVRAEVRPDRTLRLLPEGG